MATEFQIGSLTIKSENCCFRGSLYERTGHWRYWETVCTTLMRELKIFADLDVNFTAIDICSCTLCLIAEKHNQDVLFCRQECVQHEILTLCWTTSTMGGICELWILDGWTTASGLASWRQFMKPDQSCLLLRRPSDTASLYTSLFPTGCSRR